jgi:hypothetical protein
MAEQIDLFDDETLEYLGKNVPIPDDDKAAMLANLASHYETAEDSIAQLEKDLATAKEWFRRIREDLIPEKMIELGVKKIVLTDGSTLSYSDFYAGKVLNDEAFDWLEQNGYADAVKQELKLEVSRVDRVLLTVIKEMIAKNPTAYANLTAKEKQSIHHMTLGAAIRSLTKQGKELPQNLFETYIGNRATLKRGKDNG